MLVIAAQILGIVGTVLRIVTTGLLLGGLWRALARAADSRARRRAWAVTALLLVGWQAAVWLLAAAGFFRAGRIGGIPLVPAAVVLPLSLGLLALGRSRVIAAALDAGAPGFLVAVQTYRVLGAAFLVQYGLGRAPALFALPAGIGDVVVGLLAIPTARFVASGRPGATALGLAWNALGVLDLVNALSLGAMISSGALTGAAPGGGFPAIGQYPLVMIPAYAVPLSLLLHALSVRQLLRRRAARRGSGRIAAPGGASLGADAA